MAISNEELELEYKIVNPLDYLEMAHYPGCALKVYCAHLGKENLDGNSHPSIDWIIETTGMCRNTVYKGRRWLVENGKLAKVGEVSPRIPNGRYPVPVMASKNATKDLPYQNIPKVENSPIPKVGSIDYYAFDFGFASGFASAFAGGSCHYNSEPEAKPTAASVPPPAALEMQRSKEESKSKSKSSMVQENGISGKRKKQFAKDGTPWTEEMYSRDYSPVKRLEWMEAHNGKSKIDDLDKVEEPEVELEDRNFDDEDDVEIVEEREYCSRCHIQHRENEHSFPDGYGYTVGCRLDEDTVSHFLKYYPHKKCPVCGNYFVTWNGDLCALCQEEGFELAGETPVSKE